MRIAAPLPVQDARPVRALEQRVHGVESAVANVVGELVDVERDMRAHHLVAHLGRVLANVRHDRLFVRLSESQAPANRIVERTQLCPGDVVACDDGAERNRQGGHVLPPFAEVGNRDEPGVTVGEAGFVNDQPGVDLACRDRVDDAVEAHLHGLRAFAERELQEHVCRRTLSRDCDALARQTR